MSKWKEKHVLCIGDSITSDGRWQKKFSEITGAEVKTHAYGGIGLVDMFMGLGASETPDVKYDPKTGCSGAFHPLSEDEVKWADLIIILAPYNERHAEYGKRGDMFPKDDTLYGKFDFVLEHLFGMMKKTENITCHIMLAAPHCVGRYDWVDRDGYEDFPRGSGRSLETMSEVIEDIAAYFNLPFCNTWKTSGINRFTWDCFANSPTAIRPDYDPSKKYDAPYPQYADQAHLNDLGYARLGECLASWAELA